ncbi:MAG: hypothetical protein N2259_01460 [Patescibacteria group bacterium]|nr:hypothetical protein [Patescibacteria group bacterium]
MIQTSKDVLFLVLGISILVVSFFLILLLYYLMKFFRECYKVSKSFSKITDRINETTKIVKEKGRQFTLLPLLSEAIRTIIEFLKEMKRKKEEKREEVEQESKK